MRTITPELTALLRSRFQAAGSGYAARLEVDRLVDAPPPEGVTPSSDWTTSLAYGSDVLGIHDHSTSHVYGSASWPSLPTNPAAVTDAVRPGSNAAQSNFSALVADGPLTWWRGYRVDLGSEVAIDKVTIDHQGALAWPLGFLVTDEADFGALDLSGFPTGGSYVNDDADGWGTPGTSPFALLTWTFDATQTGQYVYCLQKVTKGSGLQYLPGWIVAEMLVGGVPLEGYVPRVIATLQVPQVKRINLNRNLRMGPDQASIELPNESLPYGWGPTSIFPTNSRIRSYQWFGDPANEVLTFTGVIDKISDSRDPLTTGLECRSMAGPILVDQTTSTTAPQGADEDGAVRTEDNGVYLNREVDYIAADLLDRAGWPSADIDIADTSFVLDEYVVDDGSSYWDNLAKLAGFVAYTLWDDEDAVIHLRPLGDAAGVDDALTADYEYEIGIA